jgi:two-component system response regulator NreC
MAIRILLADDHTLMRKGLRSLLEKIEDFEVVAEAQNGRNTVQLALKLEPDIVIMDISMPDLNGIDATLQITEKCPDIRIIALSIHSDRRFVTQMLKAGASGYLLKDCAFEELENAIRKACDGQMYLSPKVAGTVVKDYVSHVSRGEASVYTLLSEREREVLQLLAEGQSTKEIAASLFVSIKTVETHRQNIMKKLGIYNIPDLVKYAIREGLIDLDS